MREYLLVLLVTAAVTFLLTPLVRRVAVATRAIHAPRARDTHTEPTPLLGGLAMYGGLVAGLIVASRLTSLQDPFQAAGSKTAAGLLLAGAFVVVVGFIDDRWGLSAVSKLAGQVAAAGILVWSGQSLPWLPMPSGGVFSLEPDLSLTLTILLVVITINAINFIDGLDGLAAGIVAVAALSFLVYSYTLIKTIGNSSQSLPAVSSALLAGMCLGFLPHNFYPARIFMGDAGAMLLGLMLAYGPISSTASLDPALLTNYSDHTLDRFPTFLPLLVPAAIFVIPYADLMFAVIRRTRAGKPLMAADRQHLHHRVLNIGHSYRQSVLIMYLWAALFSVTVVSLSVVRTRLVVFVVATAVAVLTLLPVTMPRLRPWRLFAGPQAIPAVARRGTAAVAAHRGPVPAAHRGTVPASYRGTAAGATRRETRPGTPQPAGPVLNGASSSGAAPIQHAPFPGPAPLPAAPFSAAAPPPEAARYPDAPFSDDQFPNGQFPNGQFRNDQLPNGQLPNSQFPYDQPQGDQFAADQLPHDQFPGAQLPRAGRLPGVDPVAPFGPAYPVDPLGPGPASNGRQPQPNPFPAADPLTAADPFTAADPYPGSGPVPDAGPAESPDPLAPPQRRDAQPW
jgi:UDP-GlcNAc:undecaprenyl-phosphate GlcNAc-1-phosphate transferase